MGNRIELPQLPAGNEKEQLQTLYHYLYRMAETLNSNLAEIGSPNLTDSEMLIMREVINTGSTENADSAMAEAETLKTLIIKTAQFIRAAIDQYNMKLVGTYEAEGKLGRYVRKTQLDVDVTPSGITQNYTFEEVVQGLKTYEINAKNYIKTGYLRTVSSIPVYGVAIGKDVVTFSQDGTETYNDGNKVAELTADELSFYQGGNKVASYKGNRISFFYGSTEVFYISNGKIYFANDAELEAGKKLKINSTSELNIASGGKMNVESGGDLDVKSGGDINVNSGGNANIESGGKLNVKSGGDIDVASGGDINVKSGANVDIQSGGKLTVESGGGMDVKSGGALNVKSGGGMTVESGGNLYVNGGGNITIKDGNSNAIVMNKDGIDMQTAGKVLIHAKDGTASSIIFGTDEANATFMVGLSGDVKASSVTAGSISVNGTQLPGIIVSETQPSGSNIIWVKPSSSTDKQWSKTPDSYALNSSGGTLGWYRDYTVSYAADDYLSGNLYYGIKVRLYYFASSWDNVSLKARLKNGSSWIELGTQTDYCGQGSTVTLDKMTSSATTNIMSVSGGSFTVRIETNKPSGACRLVIEDFILKAKTTSSGGFSACSVFYKS